MSEVKLNWSTASVRERELTVQLEGERADGWEQHFQATVQLLRGGEWGELRLEGEQVRVSEVPPGIEEKLRHHLEGAVEQANAAQQADEAHEEAKAQDERPSAGPDSEMTERFRAFAESGSQERDVERR